MATSHWQRHRQRAVELTDRYPFAAEVLGLYLALLDVWDGPAESLVPNVIAAVEASGPETLAKAVRELGPATIDRALEAWRSGKGPDDPVERFLARACLQPLLFDRAEDHPQGTDGGCPRCGGPPQFSVRSASDDVLVSGSRSLGCARCGHQWSFSASTCPACGETTGARRTIYAEQHAGPVVEREPDETATFPHVRVEACASCQRYVLDIDLARDPRAVPEVDELAALPLALYAADQGLSKITPNLMGF